MDKKKKRLIDLCIVAVIVVVVIILVILLRPKIETETITDGAVILAEMPDLALSEADRAMAESLLGDPEIKAILTDEEGAQKQVDLEIALGQKICGDYLPEGAEVTALAVQKKTVYLSYEEGTEKRTLMVIGTDGEIYKAIGLYEVDENGSASVKALYENQNDEEYAKSEVVKG